MQTGDPRIAGEPLKVSIGDTIGCAWSGLTCLFMAGLFWTAWWRPLELDDGRWLKLGVGVMVMEFILVHSGGMLHHLMQVKAGWGRTRMAVAMAALYTVFGVGIALGFGSGWLFASYAMVMAGRLWTLVAGRWTSMDQAISQRRTAASVLLYLLLVFATLFIPVPRGGLTPGLLAEVMQGAGSGVWIDHPEKALAMGFLYFLFLGLVELRPPRRAMAGPAGAGT